MDFLFHENGTYLVILLNSMFLFIDFPFEQHMTIVLATKDDLVLD